jgi:hypothetical protein
MQQLDNDEAWTQGRRRGRVSFERVFAADKHNVRGVLLSGALYQYESLELAVKSNTMFIVSNCNPVLVLLMRNVLCCEQLPKFAQRFSNGYT